MSNKRLRKKQLQRAAPAFPPGGSFMYVPPGVAQSVQGQVFYGSTMKNSPVGNGALFSAGTPLPAQPGVDPLGKPVQFKYMPAYNTFPVDRSMGQPDIPSFEQLRRLAKMYSGITLNERYWLDMVPRMTLDVKIKKEYADQGAEAKDYQKEISYFKNFWEKPDGRQDIHAWLRMALREQTQIDELYLYKNRTRGRKLLGLWIVSGDQMKPLLDDWGMLPESPSFAYQQYPWGIPGMQYSMDMMYHYRETPAADTPYGFSRVERFILEVNQALRKKRKDLANFTEGNIPQSFMEVPEGLNWTPDQIDAFEQSWNALLAGQAQQQVRIKFLQPGMKYQAAEQYQITFDPDLFLLKIACGCYGVPVTEFGFTEDSNRSSGESQEDMVYRRTIGPNALTYSRIMTQSTNEDFSPDLHGEMFEVCLGGFEEVEDEQKKATAIVTYTDGGILGLTDAAKMANLPIDPKAPAIGRVRMTATGPIFLDDVAQPEMRKAQADATMAGYQMAANPPDPNAQNPGGDDDKPPAPGQKAASKDEPPDGKETMSRVVDALAGVEEQLRMIRARNVTPLVRVESNSDNQHHTGMMIAFMLSLEDARQLEIPGGEPAADMHVTLAYLGDMEEEPQDDLLRPHTSPFKIRDAISQVTAESRPLQGKIAGIGRFDPFDEDTSPIIALPDIPGLPEFRQKLIEAIQAVDYFVADNHGYTPHITLAYVDADKPMPIDSVPPLSLTLDTVCLVVGDNRYNFKLGDEQYPQYWEDKKKNVTRTYESSKNEAGRNVDPERGTGQVARAGAQPETVRTQASGTDNREVGAEYRRWRSRAIEDVKAGRQQRPFTSTLIPEQQQRILAGMLTQCDTVDRVKTVFDVAKGWTDHPVEPYPLERDTSPKAQAAIAPSSGGNQQQSKSAWKLRW